MAESPLLAAEVEIERRENLVNVDSKTTPVAASLYNVDTKVHGRFYGKRCSSSHLDARNASAAQENFVHPRKTTFSTVSAQSGRLPKHQRQLSAAECGLALVTGTKEQPCFAIAETVRLQPPDRDQLRPIQLFAAPMVRGLRPVWRLCPTETINVTPSRKSVMNQTECVARGEGAQNG
jgi:hypothetical protein